MNPLLSKGKRQVLFNLFLGDGYSLDPKAEKSFAAFTSFGGCCSLWRAIPIFGILHPGYRCQPDCASNEYLLEKKFCDDAWHFSGNIGYISIFILITDDVGAVERILDVDLVASRDINRFIRSS